MQTIMLFDTQEKKTDGKILESSCSSTGFTEFYSIMKSVLASYAWIYLFAIVKNTGYVKPGFFFPRKKHEIQCMLTHFQSVDGLTETICTIKSGGGLELRAFNSDHHPFPTWKRLHSAIVCPLRDSHAQGNFQWTISSVIVGEGNSFHPFFQMSVPWF